MKVAILGLGTVGTQVVKILQKNKNLIAARAGVEIIPQIGLVKNIDKKRDIDIKITDDFNKIINDENIDVFVELIGGVDEPYKIVKKILDKNKPLVTANKALLAYHKTDIQRQAINSYVGYEASVAGGIPIIKALKEGLSANNINSIEGIMNGTSNFILTSMMNYGDNFENALKTAQKMGYAEADPIFDICGFDAAHKLLILSSIAYGIDAKPEDILIEGIERINQSDIFFAKDFEYTIKLLGIAKKSEQNIELRVHPTLVPKNKMIAKVDGVMNAISVTGDAVGETMFYGAGAGGEATASAVISDLIDIARKSNSPMLGYKKDIKNQNFKLLSQDKIKTKYYIRLKVLDQVGVLAKITELMSKNNLSIDSFLQKPKRTQDDQNLATLFFTTHLSYEADVKKVLGLLKNESFVKKEPFMIRIEE